MKCCTLNALPCITGCLAKILCNDESLRVGTLAILYEQHPVCYSNVLNSSLYLS